ncbi:hypothetical protein RN001_013376 [Aquatica leii]|uniref:Cytochrome P450 n=1 Tax=Aquatica leii TaxID=1421715 RepID=A0AAN7P2C6_9COLE|nr:hypothetical protein RN001_013376 [Aquatica leii]
MHITPLPILGNSSKILFRQTSILDYSHDLYKTFSHERYYGSHQFNSPVLHIKDIDLIKKITVKSFDQFVDRNGSITEDVDPLIGKSLLNLKGQRWRDMRAILSPSFTSSKMKMMFELISECAKEFTKYFEKQNKTLFEVEMKDIFTRYTNDAIATVAFGFKCNSVENENNEFYKMAKEATKFSGTAFLKFFLYSCIPKLSKFLKLRLIPTPAATFFRRIVKDTLNKREKEGLIRPDMIHLLMEARTGIIVNDDSYVPDAGFAATTESKILHSETKPKLKLSDEDITAQALIFISGGFETSSTLMSFIAYELAMNEEIQKKLQMEIDKTLYKCNGKLTYEAVHKMKYMDMVVSET